MKCAIISGGESSNISNIRQYDYVIACDYGLQHCINQGVSPDIAIGDFDSYTAEVTSSVRVIHFSKDKDDTDTLLAVKHAISLGYADIDIMCAMGGRIDHQLANIQTLVYATHNGVNCRIISDTDSLYCVSNGSITISNKPNHSLSVFSHSTNSCGVTISGAKYTLSNATLNNNCPIGVSNEFLGDSATISVSEGTLVIVVSRVK